MKNEEILDQEIETKKFSFSIKVTRIIFLIIVIIILANLWFINNFPLQVEGGRSLDGSQLTSEIIRKAFISGVLFSIPSIGFFLGLITSLIPYKKLSYKQKYFRFSLIVILILELLVLVPYLPKIFSFLK